MSGSTAALKRAVRQAVASAGGAEAVAAAMADGEVSSAEAVRLAVEVTQLITAAQSLLGKLKGEA